MPDPVPENTVDNGVESIEFLSRSQTRVQIMDELRAVEHLSKDELKERVDASRTNLQRGLDTLVGKGWIRNSHQDYRITPAGELVAADFFRLADTMQTASKLEAFLQWAPSDFDLDLRTLTDATILVSDPANPYGMVNHHVKTLREMDYCRSILPLTGLHAYEALHQNVVDEGARAESIVAPGVAETFQTDPDYAPLTEAMADTGRYTFHVYDGTIPYAVMLIDDIVQIGVADENNMPQALLETTAAEVQQWAEDRYRDYKAASSQVL